MYRVGGGGRRQPRAQSDRRFVGASATGVARVSPRQGAGRPKPKGQPVRRPVQPAPRRPASREQLPASLDRASVAISRAAVKAVRDREQRRRAETDVRVAAALAAARRVGAPRLRGVARLDLEARSNGGVFKDLLLGPQVRAVRVGEDGRRTPVAARPDKAEVAVLAALNETMRPVRAIAGATDAAIKGKNVPQAAAKGLLKNKGPLFGDVLRDAGAPKGVAAAGGFVLDVGLDPTTYLTLGTGSVAKQAAAAAARTAAQKAARAGMSEAGQRTVAKQAAKRAAEKAAPGRGVTVRFAGREAPGVRKGTAAVGRVVQRKTPKRVGRAVARELNPRVAPAGVARGSFVQMKQTERSARAMRAQSARRASDRGMLYSSRVSASEYEKVIDAIERQQIKSLPAGLQPVARKIRDELRGELRQRRQGGVATGDITKARAGAMGYVPHVAASELGDKAGAKAGQGSTLRPSSSRTRTDRRTIANINKGRLADGDTPLSTNLPMLYADYVARSGNARARAMVSRGLVEHGRDAAREVKAQIAKGAAPRVKLKEGESVYHVGGATGTSKETTRGIRQVDAKSEEFARFLRSGTTREGGRYVVLPDALVEDAFRNLGANRTAAGAVFDRAMGVWKGAVTATPAFHVRNAIGDAQMGFLGQRGHRMPTNYKASRRVVKEQTRRDKAQRQKIVPSSERNATVRVAGKDMPVARFVDEMSEHGVLRSGQRARELQELFMGSGEVTARNFSSKAGKVRRKANRAWAPTERFLRNLEDYGRAATYKDARDRGMSPAKAADWSMKHHIDYGDVTEFERVFGRRFAPFWTFNARSIPLHAERLVTNPGKFATLEKARLEAGVAAGMEPGWEREGTAEYKQRAVPFPARIGGREYGLDANLPAASLNEVPGFMGPKDQLAEWGNFAAGLTTPALKIPAELIANRSFFFRKDIQSEDYPLVSAPSWATKLPGGWQKRLGVTKIKDRRSGKMVPGWPGRVDYLVRQVPGFAQTLNSLSTQGAGRSGRAGWEKPVSASGVKVDPVDRDTARIVKLFDEQAKLTEKINGLRQQDRGGGLRSPDAEVRALAQRIRRIDEEIFRLSAKRGDATPLREGSIPKGRAVQLRGGSAVRGVSGLSAVQQRLMADRAVGGGGLSAAQQAMIDRRIREATK